MIGAPQRYQELLNELLLQRELRGGGALSTEDEAAFAAEMDRCWAEMTDDEQDAAERSFAERNVVGAPEALNYHTLAVERGQRIPPKAA
jgi:hypothetical protein